MTTELKSTFIPADLHKWLYYLKIENGTSVQVEVEKALREAKAMREQSENQASQRKTAAVAQ